jgi:uncharacterized protein YqiB (DUF1249 family)
MKMSLRDQQRYSPSLDQMIGQCTVNYVQLLKLFPNIRDLAKGDIIRFHLSALNQAIVTCTITEAAPYTTFLTFSQEVLSDQPLVDPLQLRINVRLYHDAQLAEVVDAEQKSVLPGRFSYPNRRMYQVDEKAQCNRFLGEWLAYCRQHGLACDQPTVGQSSDDVQTR